MKYKELVSKYDHVKRVYQAGLLVALTTLALNCFSLAVLCLLLLLFILVTAFRSLKICFYCAVHCFFIGNHRSSIKDFHLDQHQHNDYNDYNDYNDEHQHNDYRRRGLALLGVRRLLHLPLLLCCRRLLNITIVIVNINAATSFVNQMVEIRLLDLAKSLNVIYNVILTFGLLSEG